VVLINLPGRLGQAGRLLLHRPEQGPRLRGQIKSSSSKKEDLYYVDPELVEETTRIIPVI
jgi:hypothetical protein